MSKVIYISRYRKFVSPNFWLYDYLYEDGFQIVSYDMYGDDEESNVPKWKRLLKIFQLIWFVTLKNNKDDIYLFYGCLSPALYCGLVLSLIKSKKILSLINFMGGETLHSYTPLKKLLIKKAFRNLIVSVNNLSLVEIYSKLLNIERKKFNVIPDSTAEFAYLANEEDTSSNEYVFFGGNSRRDFNLLVEAAKQLPNIRFVAVTSHRNSHIFKGIPKNLEMHYSLPINDFINKIKRSALVFIPLKTDSQAGQLVCFQGALLRKTIITTDTIAIRTYFDKESAVLIPRGDADSAISAISKLHVNKALRDRLSKNAYNKILNFSPEVIYSSYIKKHFLN